MKTTPVVAVLLMAVVGSTAQPCRGPHCAAIDVDTLTTMVCWGVSTVTCWYRVDLILFHCPNEQIGEYYFNRMCYTPVPGCAGKSDCVTNQSFTLEELIGAVRMTLFSYYPFRWFNTYNVVRVIHPQLLGCRWCQWLYRWMWGSVLLLYRGCAGQSWSSAEYGDTGSVPAIMYECVSIGREEQ